MDFWQFYLRPLFIPELYSVQRLHIQLVCGQRRQILGCDFTTKLSVTHERKQSQENYRSVLVLRAATATKYTNLNKIDDVIDVTMENKIESQEHLNVFLQAEEKCLLTSYILSYLFSWICMNLKQNPCLAFAGLYLNKVYAL